MNPWKEKQIFILDSHTEDINYNKITRIFTDTLSTNWDSLPRRFNVDHYWSYILIHEMFAYNNLMLHNSINLQCIIFTIIIDVGMIFSMLYAVQFTFNFPISLYRPSRCWMFLGYPRTYNRRASDYETDQKWGYIRIIMDSLTGYEKGRITIRHICNKLLTT